MTAAIVLRLRCVCEKPENGSDVQRHLLSEVIDQFLIFECVCVDVG